MALRNTKITKLIKHLIFVWCMPLVASERSITTKNKLVLYIEKTIKIFVTKGE